MPLFEYRCSACAHLEEVLQKHGEPPPPACPKCGKPGTLAKEMSLTSFQLKGGGWYKDLYASSKSSDTGSSSDGAASTTPSTKSATADGSSSSASSASSSSASSGSASSGSASSGSASSSSASSSSAAP